MKRRRTTKVPPVNENAAPPVVFTVMELVARWRCDRRTVMEAIKADRLRAFRISKREYRIALAEVERYERTREAA